MIGDELIFVNGLPVGVGLLLRPESKVHDLTSVQSMLNDNSLYPIALTFARQTASVQNKSRFDIDSMKTLSVVIYSPEQLGVTIGHGSDSSHFVVKKFHAVSGKFQKELLETIVELSRLQDLSIYSINGEVVPSYASCDMVMSAMKRSWKNKEKVDLVLYDHELKEKVNSLSSASQ